MQETQHTQQTAKFPYPTIFVSNTMITYSDLSLFVSLPHLLFIFLSFHSSKTKVIFKNPSNTK